MDVKTRRQAGAVVGRGGVPPGRGRRIGTTPGPCYGPSMREGAPTTSLGDHAVEELQFIRDTMARAAGFTAVPGWGGVLMGLTALVTAVFAGTPGDARWLTWWIGDAAVAGTVGLVTMAAKGRRVGTPLGGTIARRFAWAVAPALVAGVVMTAVFVRHGLAAALPGCWLLLYGAAITSGGAHSIRVVPVTGLAFMVLGVCAFLMPPVWGNMLMALGFGLVHLVSGSLIARRYGG